ncbi:ABC transporter permease subunit, partial [Candidatus Bathyarchaeota archaeon]|nr:ABC transporter permease subunit [Candidatus Bathyarchaeota archaeon]
RDIIKKEVLEGITSAKFVFTFLLCSILILLSVYTGITNYSAEQKEYATAVALNKKNMESQPNFLALGGLGTKITKPPQVLSTIAIGVSEAVGRVAKVDSSSDPSLVDSKYESNPVYSVFGTLDLTFIVKIVLSLFAILFTYNAIAGEKEMGTLKLTLSNRVPRDQLILGKGIGGLISLLIPLIIPMVISLIILLVYPNINLSGQDWVRLMFMFLLFLLYLSVFFSLGLFVSARTHKSSTSFLILLFIWVVFVTIIPKVSVMVAAQIKPIPSIHEITAKKDAFLMQVRMEEQKITMNYLKENMKKTGQTDQESFEQYKKWGEKNHQEYTDKINSYNASLERDYQVKKRAQEQLAVNLSRISPASALMIGSMSLARTGPEEHARFLASVRIFKPTFAEWINTKMYNSLNLKDRQTLEMGSKPILDDMPQHKFEPESLAKSLGRILPDFGLMLFLVVFFFVGAYISFIKYDVR